MDKLPKQFQYKLDLLKLLGVDDVARIEVAKFTDEYARYRLNEFIADHFPDENKNTKFVNKLTEKDCKELDDCLSTIFGEAHKTIL